VAMISTLQDRPFRGDAEPYESVLVSTEDEGFRFFLGLLIALGLSGCLYGGMCALLLSLLN
jgi:hypothetical protein